MPVFSKNISVLDHWTNAGSGSETQNEDVWGLADSQDNKISIAYVIDGCTDVDIGASGNTYPDGMTNARWHAQRLAYHLQHGLNETIIFDPKRFIGDIVNCVREDYEGVPGLHFDVEDWAYPSSTLVALVVAPEHNLMRRLWIGDCSCIIGKNRGPVSIDPPLVIKCREAAEDMMLGKINGSALLKDNMEHHRVRRVENIRNGVSLSLFPDRLDKLNWSDADLRASCHGDCRMVLLASDGLMRMVTHYGILETPGQMFDVVENQGLPTVGKWLRSHEARHAQALGKLHSKTRDDATGLFLFPTPQLT